MSIPASSTPQLVAWKPPRRERDRCRRSRPGFRPGSRLGAALLALCTLGPACAQPISPAEVLLFETDHLARMKAPTTLVYEFRRQSNVEPAFTDSVQLDVSRNKGQLHAVLRFLTGARKQALPEVDDAHGNPVLLGFLERDIAEMKRLTGGSVGYFRKRIRLALANGAKVTPQRITYGGKAVEAKAVRIQPYLDDPLHARFENYVRKTYTFVLSDDVPGGVYRVSTTLANAASGPAPGTVVARTAAPDAAKPGAASAGAAARRAAGPAATQATTPATKASRQPGKAEPGTALPVIDETLTLVKVTEPRG
ncbi:hypothetical protein [Massilia niabensis]|uniref:DUF3108 domain-containing protein n=1 Tax=Massilia niabensis TaxID=544910 RepID=A0ABW0KXE8_9BURK